MVDTDHTKRTREVEIFGTTSQEIFAPQLSFQPPPTITEEAKNCARRIHNGKLHILTPETGGEHVVLTDQKYAYKINKFGTQRYYGIIVPSDDLEAILQQIEDEPHVIPRINTSHLIRTNGFYNFKGIFDTTATALKAQLYVPHSQFFIIPMRVTQKLARYIGFTDEYIQQLFSLSAENTSPFIIAEVQQQELLDLDKKSDISFHTGYAERNVEMSGQNSVSRAAYDNVTKAFVFMDTQKQSEFTDSPLRLRAELLSLDENIKVSGQLGSLVHHVRRAISAIGDKSLPPEIIQNYENFIISITALVDASVIYTQNEGSCLDVVNSYNIYAKDYHSKPFEGVYLMDAFYASGFNLLSRANTALENLASMPAHLTEEEKIMLMQVFNYVRMINILAFTLNRDMIDIFSIMGTSQETIGKLRQIHNISVMLT
jgi:hypothetical protein